MMAIKFSVFPPDLGIDLGTSNTVIYVKNKGIVLREPSIVAEHPDTGKVIAIGSEAKQMLNQPSNNLKIIRPIKESAIANTEIARQMIKYFIRKAIGSSYLFKTKAIISISSGINVVERRAVIEMAIPDCRKVLLVEKCLAAATSFNIDMVNSAEGIMLIDMGGGTTDICIISQGGILESSSTYIGGNKIDEAIIRYVRRVYSLVIDEVTAEKLKIDLGNVLATLEIKTADIQGTDLLGRFSRNEAITNKDIYQAINKPIYDIVDEVKAFLEKIPPELASGIKNRGIVLVGGGALLRGFAQLLSQETMINVYIAENPSSCVALGLGIIIGLLNI